MVGFDVASLGLGGGGCPRYLDTVHFGIEKERFKRGLYIREK